MELSNIFIPVNETPDFDAIEKELKRQLIAEGLISWHTDLGTLKTNDHHLDASRHLRGGWNANCRHNFPGLPE